MPAQTLSLKSYEVILEHLQKGKELLEQLLKKVSEEARSRVGAIQFHTVSFRVQGGVRNRPTRGPVTRSSRCASRKWKPQQISRLN